MMEQQPTIVPDGLVGKTVGNYIVRYKLGEGGMGSVYFAEHPSIGKRVALKVLHAEFASQPEIVSRFFNEARAVNDIQHPNIVDIVDFGTIPPAVPTDPAMVYFLMEYIEGARLTDVIRREAPLPPDRATTIALQIADALSASHAKGIVHRDLKPDNVMLVTRGRERDLVKLLDFGIAKLTGTAASTHRTRTGMVIGTPEYMSPEQCEGLGNIDHRTDVYALGIVLYQMLTGQVPFAGDGFGEVLVQQMATPPLAPSVIVPLIPEPLELVVLKALEKRADDRYPRMDELALALQGPAQYIEARGGRSGFLAAPVVRDPALTGPRAVMAMFQASSSGAPTRWSRPGTSPTGSPTTLGGSASQVAGAPPVRPRRRVVAAVAVAAGLAALGGAAMIATTSRDGSPAERAGQAAQQPPPPQPTPAVPAARPPVAPAPRAPAPPPPPAAEPESPAAPAATLSVTIESTPLGAQVFVGSEPAARGTTPYVLELPPPAVSAEIRLVHAGYKPLTATIDPHGDSKRSFALEQATAASPRPAGSPAVGVKPDARPAVPDDRDDTMDPFKKKGTR